MDISYHFAVPLIQFQHPDKDRLNRELKDLILHMEAQGDRFRDTVKRDTQGGPLFESNFDLFYRPEKPLRELAAFCHESLARAIFQLSDYSREEFARLEWEYDAWFHVTRKGGYQGLHNHNNASWSGIYCIDTGGEVPGRPDSGRVRFHDPRTNANYYADPGMERLKPPVHYGGFDLTHQAGQLSIFPSYLLHEIFPFVGDGTRIIVAFNSWVKVRGQKSRR